MSDDEQSVETQLSTVLSELDEAIEMVNADFMANRTQVESLITDFSGKLRFLTDRLLEVNDLHSLELLHSKVSDLLEICRGQRDEAKKSLMGISKGSAGIAKYKLNRR